MKADTAQMEQALMNLVFNARDASAGRWRIDDSDSEYGIR